MWAGTPACPPTSRITHCVSTCHTQVTLTTVSGSRHIWPSCQPETLLLHLALPGLHILLLPLAFRDGRPITLSGSKPLGHAAWTWTILRTMHLTLARGSPRLLVLIGRPGFHPRPVILGQGIR